MALGPRSLGAIRIVSLFSTLGSFFGRLAPASRSDKGLTLHKWHEAMIVELYGTLDDDGIEAITRHRLRAHGRGPLEQENVALPDLDSLLPET
jgi:hypothetical protein